MVLEEVWMTGGGGVGDVMVVGMVLMGVVWC